MLNKRIWLIRTQLLRSLIFLIILINNVKVQNQADNGHAVQILRVSGQEPPSRQFPSNQFEHTRTIPHPSFINPGQFPFCHYSNTGNFCPQICLFNHGTLVVFVFIELNIQVSFKNSFAQMLLYFSYIKLQNIINY